MFEFDYPLAFLFLPLPILVYFITPRYRDHSAAVRAPFFQRVAELSGQTPSKGSIVRRKNIAQRIVLLLSWLLVVISVARPIQVQDPIVQNISARDMLLLIDLSGSMEESDFSTETGEQISRLDAVKTVLGEFIERREGDRIGLAVFGDSAFPQTSFTEDLVTVNSLLDELEPRMAGARTMIGDAIGLAIRLFETSEKEHKVAILLTDGNDTGSKMPVGKAAQIAADNNIVFHTIAMGDPETVGEQALDMTLLRNISTTTGGNFYVALDRSELNGIYEELDRIESELLDTLSYRPTTDFYFVPLALLVLLNMLFMLAKLLVKFRRGNTTTASVG